MGKGSKRRPTDEEKYKAGWERAFGKSQNTTDAAQAYGDALLGAALQLEKQLTELFCDDERTDH